MVNPHKSEIPRDARRVPCDVVVTLRLPGRQPIQEKIGNLSMGGLFICSRAPLAVGTVTDLEFQLMDQWLEAKGQILWNRARDEGHDQPAGMGVIFIGISQEGRRLIHEFVEAFIESGGQPLQSAPARPRAKPVLREPAIEDPQPAATEPGVPRISPRVPPRPRAAASGRRKKAVLLSLIVLPLAAAGVWLALPLLTRAPEPPVEELPLATERVAVEEPAEPDPPPPDAEPEPASLFTGVDDIAWQHKDGQLVVVLEADGPIEDYSHLRLEGKELVRITGVARPYHQTVIPVRAAGLEQIRTGYHPSPSGNELHIVLDLQDPELRIAEILTPGRELVLRFTRG